MISYINHLYYYQLWKFNEENEGQDELCRRKIFKFSYNLIKKLKLDRQSYIHNNIHMEFGSKLTQSKEYSTPVIRQHYASNNGRLSTPNQRLDEIRKKYDTPTRKQLKQIQVRNNVTDKTHINQDLDLRKSTHFGDSIRQKYGNPSSKMHEMSPASAFRKENIINEEETIFKKIKEMKDTLLQKNGNDKIKTTKSIYQPKPQDKMQSRAHMIDHRLQNIDRINAKFQQILNCLRESQTKTPLLESQFHDKSKDRIEVKQNIKATDLKFSPLTAPKTSQFVYPEAKNSRTVTQFQPQSISQPSQFANQGQNRSYQQYQSRSPNLQSLNKIEVRNTASVYQEDRKYKMSSPAPKNYDNYQTNSSKGGDPSKTKSFISTIQKQTGKDCKYEMKSGKKLDDQINKIQSKIQQFQQEKRRLNIDFKPYSHSNSKSSSNLTKRSYTIDKFQGITYQNKTIQNDVKKSEDFTRKSLIGYEKYYERANQGRNIQNKANDMAGIEVKNVARFAVNQQFKEKKYGDLNPNLQMTKRLQKLNSENDQLFKIKLIPVDEQKNSASSSRVQNRLLSQDLKRRTDDGILDRKKKLTTEVSRSKVNIKKLVQKLSAQAQLDETFRNNKLYFQSNVNNKKWTELEDELRKNGISLQKQKLEKVFKITDEQNNPFFSVRQNSTNVQGLAKSYIDCEEHWKKELTKKISKQQLMSQQFSCDSLDLEKKGYIVLEDIVRFLNMETGTFYRNRDLYLIFKRISEHDKINFNQLIETFCK